MNRQAIPMTRCAECKAEYAARATLCPRCGEENRGRAAVPARPRLPERPTTADPVAAATAARVRRSVPPHSEPLSEGSTREVVLKDADGEPAVRRVPLRLLVG